MCSRVWSCRVRRMALQHVADQGHRVLAIRIHQHHHFAACGIDPRHECRLFAKVAREVQAHHFMVVLAKLVDHFCGGIAAAVVDQDQLHLRAQGLQRCQYMWHQISQIGGFVVSRHDA